MFVFPYSYIMQSYVFGNFEEQLTFDALTDEDVVEVLNEINQSLHGNTKDSLSLINMREEDSAKRAVGLLSSAKLLVDCSPETSALVEDWSKLRAAVCKLAVCLLWLPAVSAVSCFVLFAAGIISKKLELLVKLISVYLPALLFTVFLASVTRLVSKKRIEVAGRQLQTAQKDSKISNILSKWNREKFHALNFSWTYKKDADCLELSVDPDLEVYESK